jgi:hypothetical protein
MILEHAFELRHVPDPTFGPTRNGTNRCPGTQPNRRIMRLMRVIADPTLHPRRQVAVEVTLRALLVAAVAGLILGILPAVAGAVA